MLAQAIDNEQLHSGIARILDYSQGLQFPSRGDFAAWLETLNYWEAGALMLAGVLLLLWGLKVFKVLVIVNAAAVGVVIGVLLGLSLGPVPPMLTGLIGGALLGLLAWPMLKLAAGLLGAILGGGLGAIIWLAACNAAGQEALAQSYWIGGIVGAGVVGVLAVLLFRPAVMALTALQGGSLLTIAVIRLLLDSPSLGQSLRPALVENELMLPLAACVLAVFGFLFQFVRSRQAEAKPAQATAKQK
jgi:hypothetical protein